MKARPFFPSLAVAAFLVLSAGCSKKADPYAPPKVAPSAGSYNLNGRITSSGVATSRQITAQVRTVTTSDNFIDQLEVRFTTIPKPAIGEEHLLLTFIKDKDQPATAYRYFGGAYYTNFAPYALFTNAVATIMPTSNGAFSGTFSAECSGQVGTPSQTDYTIYGSFTNANP